MLQALLQCLKSCVTAEQAAARPLLQATDHLGTYVGAQVAHAAAASSMVAIDLGSMPRMGFVPDATGFVEALHDTLDIAQLRGLILTGDGAAPALGMLSPQELACCRVVDGCKAVLWMDAKQRFRMTSVWHPRMQVHTSLLSRRAN